MKKVGVTIKIPEGAIKLLRDLGLTPQDVVEKGLEAETELRAEQLRVSEDKAREIYCL